MRKFFKIILIPFLLNITMVNANLLITPSKVNFADRERSKQIVLINNTNSVQTYRISWTQYKADENGLYSELTDEEVKEFAIASPMIRFSPKQVSIKPNDSQVIKLSLRRPSKLKEGEYRSHLRLSILPPRQKASNSNSERGNSATVLLNYILPIIVKQGTGESIAAIEKIDLVKENNKSRIKIKMSKEGAYSVNGDLKVYLVSKGNKTLIGSLNDVTFYHELNTLFKTLDLKGFNSNDGIFHVEFVGRKDNEGKIFSELESPVSSLIVH